MTDADLRNLFHDAAPDPDRPDPAAIDRAWRDGNRRRVAARTAVVGSIAATAAAVTGVVMLDPGSPVTTTPSSQDDKEDSDDPNVAVYGSQDIGADLTIDATSLWFSPTTDEELALPAIDPARSLLPEQISLTDDAPSATESPLPSAVAALAPYGDEPIDRLLLVDPDGERRWLDLTGLTYDGDRVRPVTTQMLSPDGQTLLFSQDGHVMGFDIPTGQWSRLDAGAAGTERLGEAVEPEDPFPMRAGTRIGLADSASGEDGSFTVPVGEDFEPYGRAPSRGDRTVQSWLGSEFRLTTGDRTQRAMHVAIVDEGARDRGLLFNDADSSPNARWLHCCPVVGWLDDETLVYESRKADPQLIAWTIGSEDFQAVTRITDLPAQTSYVASWAFSAH